MEGEEVVEEDFEVVEVVEVRVEVEVGTEEE